MSHQVEELLLKTSSQFILYFSTEGRRESITNMSNDLRSELLNPYTHSQ